VALHRFRPDENITHLNRRIANIRQPPLAENHRNLLQDGAKDPRRLPNSQFWGFQVCQGPQSLSARPAPGGSLGEDCEIKIHL
jgi:hypothetical protein